MKKRLLITLLATALFCTLFGCAQPIKGVGTAKGYLSGLEPVDSLSADFYNGYNTFSTKLLQQLYTEKADIFISPASLYIALGMTAGGADNNTLSQMLNTMGVTDAEALNTGCRDLQSLLTGNPKDYFKLSNAVWLDKKYKDKIKLDFLAHNEEYFGALVAAAPFDDTLFPTINKWAAQNTDGMVKDVMEPPLDPDVFMYLTNALLFDGKWEMKFKKSDTKNGVFHGATGDVTLPMMHRTDEESATWFEDDAVEATLLDYKDERTAMLIVLPKNNLADVMAAMTADTIPAWLDSIQECYSLSLTLPRFSLTYKEELTKALKALGITDAFDVGTADFGRLIDPVDKDIPVINRVIHQTALEVDESGTRAAAVSIFQFANKSAAGPEKSMIVDRPFFCAIVDKPTGAVLFEGVVNNPQQIE